MDLKKFVGKYIGSLEDGTLSKAELGRKLMEQHPEKYKNGEQARTAVRRMAEKLGIKNSTKKRRSLAKVLLFDIETAPFLAYAFSKWSNINDDFILKPSNIISWSAKWLFEDQVHHMCVTPDEQMRGNDKRVAEGLWALMDEADIVIAHNLKKFDKKIAQSSFLRNGLYIPSHFQEIDTLAVVRKQFKAESNRLDYWTKKLMGIEGKKPTGSELWVKCAGNAYTNTPPCQESLDKMVDYCDHDVRLLEELYLYIRGYITNHPNIALFTGNDDLICKACGEDSFSIIGEYTTIVNRYQGYRCNNCGSVHRSRKTLEKSNVKLR